MSLQYIIDGYNTINHPLFARINRKTRDNRIALLEFIKIKRLTGSAKNRITLVFDGYPDTHTPVSEQTDDNNIDIIFARKETADERIKKIVQDSCNPKTIVVVSDDKEIKFFVKAFGVRVLSVEEFINRRKDLVDLPKLAPAKPELTYSQMHKINQELKNLWLKQ